MNRVVIYCQEDSNIQKKIEELKVFINKKDLELVNGFVDSLDESERLIDLSIGIEANKADIILLYSIENIKNEFNLQFLKGISKAEKVRIYDYLNDTDII
ncbi:hypothetical protein [Pontibacillus sp. HMF3514]|uniref:hypothetical protein n=1 Tax=Pontibacillus sp. HMF3514 TaxID=2692425 RepID=UPI0013202ED8|nr:hypothetical protein [Pontibacillus sp. HMF3514]QHE51680.1 hypothetical protein GS400_06355 [Pontibacillus sp. HMF3514]